MQDVAAIVEAVDIGERQHQLNPLRSEIGLAHLRIVSRSRSTLPSASTWPRCMHRDAFGDLAHEGHVVLDHDDGVRPLRLLTICEVLWVSAWVMPAVGSSSRMHLRVLRDQQPELEPLGLAVAEIGGEPGRPLRSGQSAPAPRRRPAWRSHRSRSRRLAQHAGIAAARHLKIAADGQILEHARDLELPPDAGAGDLVLFPVGDVGIVAGSTRPCVLLVLPEIRSISVVLPAPLAPSSTRSSPSSIVIDTC